jgi:hypothetical protein
MHGMTAPAAPDDFGITTAVNDPNTAVLWERRGTEVAISFVPPAEQPLAWCLELPTATRGEQR